MALLCAELQAANNHSGVYKMRALNAPQETRNYETLKRESEGERGQTCLPIYISVEGSSSNMEQQQGEHKNLNSRRDKYLRFVFLPPASEFSSIPPYTLNCLGVDLFCSKDFNQIPFTDDCCSFYEVHSNLIDVIKSESHDFYVKTHTHTHTGQIPQRERGRERELPPGKLGL